MPSDEHVADLAPDSPLVPMLKTVRRSGERAAGIVRDLLTLGHGGLPDPKLIDMAGVDGRAPWDDYRQLLRELELFDPALLDKPHGLRLHCPRCPC